MSQGYTQEQINDWESYERRNSLNELMESNIRRARQPAVDDVPAVEIAPPEEVVRAPGFASASAAAVASGASAAVTPRARGVGDGVHPADAAQDGADENPWGVLS